MALVGMGPRKKKVREPRLPCLVFQKEDRVMRGRLSFGGVLKLLAAFLDACGYLGEQRSGYAADC